MNYPIMIDLNEKTITVIGGGRIALRKTQNFIKFGCRVKVISKDFIEEFYNLENNIELIKGEYKEEYIKNSFIVIAATNNKEINKNIGIFCREKDKLVNVVDNPELSNFIVPSYIKRGDLIIGVSTSGKSPSLAAKIKRDLELLYDDNYAEYVDLLGKLRIEILRKYNDSNIKRSLLNELINLSIEELKKFNV